MEKTRSAILIKKLVNNQLNKKGLDELLKDIKEQKKEKEYTEILRLHFEKLVDKFSDK